MINYNNPYIYIYTYIAQSDLYVVATKYHNLSFCHFSDTCVQTCTYNVRMTFVLTCDK